MKTSQTSKSTEDQSDFYRGLYLKLHKRQKKGEYDEQTKNLLKVLLFSLRVNYGDTRFAFRIQKDIRYHLEE